MMTIADFINRMIRFFPKTAKLEQEHLKEYGELLSYVFVEDDIMPEVIDLIKKSKDIPKLKEMFSFFEEVSVQEDEDLINLFSIAVLENIGTDSAILEKAKKYMGPATAKLQRERDISISNPLMHSNVNDLLERRH